MRAASGAALEVRQVLEPVGRQKFPAPGLSDLRIVVIDN